jgi:3-oxoacyl-[acyl-carrier-protein] synthase II
VAPVITGIGLITPLGRSTSATFDALLAGRCISTHTRLEAAKCGDLPRVVSLAIEAADEAIAQARWGSQASNAAVVACTSKGSVEAWLNPPMARSFGPYDVPCFGLADLSVRLARHIGSADAPRLTLSAACASGLHGLIRAAMMIRSGEAARVLVVAAEASVHPLFVGSFERLGVLVPSGGICRPFDVHRNGFLMSEAAAAVCLEAGTEPNLPRAITAVERFALGGDATHLTGSDPDGAVLRHLLRTVIGVQPMDLIHAHGTGTIANDATELTALTATLIPKEPALLYSHKAALGHTLGASGLVAVALNCFMHQRGQVPGNINTQTPLAAESVKIAPQASTARIRHSLVLAAGFGGPAAVVRLSGGDERDDS